MTAARTTAEQGTLDWLTATVELRRRMPGIETHPYPYLGLDDFVLQHGRFYESQKLTKDELNYLQVIKANYGKRFLPKQCFYNSQMWLLTTDRFLTAPPGMVLRYVEGYSTSVIPIHHGWLTLNGKVIDPTLRMAGQPRKSLLPGRTVGTFPEEVVYFGVPFTTDEVYESVTEREEGGTLILDMKRDYPFLKRPYTVTP